MLHYPLPWPRCECSVFIGMNVSALCSILVYSLVLDKWLCFSGFNSSIAEQYIWRSESVLRDTERTGKECSGCWLCHWRDSAIVVGQDDINDKVVDTDPESESFCLLFCWQDWIEAVDRLPQLSLIDRSLIMMPSTTCFNLAHDRNSCSQQRPYFNNETVIVVPVMRVSNYLMS